MCTQLRIVVAASLLAACTGDRTISKPPIPEPPPQSPYDPYPANILPSDLDSEVARVRAEARTIFERALSESARVPAPTTSGNPPTQQGGYAAEVVLGKLLAFDEALSVDSNSSCGACHMPYTGFSSPIPSLNATAVALPGSAAIRMGKRTAQRMTYASLFPVLMYNADEALFFGGNFWDGRATGARVQSPNVEQAEHPPLDGNELAFADEACIAYRVSQAAYRPLFETLWGTGLLDIDWPDSTDAICATPNGATELGTSATPIPLSDPDRARVVDVLDRVSESMSLYETSTRLNGFTSKFDASLAGTYTLTADEAAGQQLFDGKANCNSCHLDGRGTASTGESDTSDPANVAPLFTCFGFANIGLPMNPRVAFFYEDKPDSLGFTPNPYGFGFRDLGMGTFLRSGFGSAPNPNPDWTQYAPISDGAVQVASARDVGLSPCPTTEAGQLDSSGQPVPYFQKAFFHNGYAKSLKQLVHFYNTRDTFAYPVTSGHCPSGTTERVDCWPMPEVPNNIDMTFGNLGLTDREEDQLVAFLQTLDDGFTAPLPDADTFTGTCASGGSAATQGNELLIATPELPPCASDICGVAPLPTPMPIASQATGGVPAGATPVLELARGDLAIVAWTIDNPGGKDTHYGVVRYGTDPAHLDSIARSPVRVNPGHAQMTYRVRMSGLRPGTTYYFSAATTRGNGSPETAASATGHFTMPGQ